MTVDIARLTTAKEKGITQALDDATVNGNLPAEYRDPGRPLVRPHQARPRRLRLEGPRRRTPRSPMPISPTRSGRARSASAPASTTTISRCSRRRSPIGAPEKTEEWMTGLKANLARKPDGGDRAAGQGDLRRRMRHRARQHLLCRPDADQREGAGARRSGATPINVIFPTFENGGTHVNISGAALAKNAPNRDNAVKLIQFLSSHEAQQIYAEKNFEYPVEPGLEPSEIVKSFGDAEGRHAAAGRHRQEPQGGFRDGRPRRPRRRPEQLSRFTRINRKPGRAAARPFAFR